jgi:hypothetical protein
VKGKTITEIDRFMYVATKDFHKKKMEAKGIAVQKIIRLCEGIRD